MKRISMVCVPFLLSALFSFIPVNGQSRSQKLATEFEQVISSQFKPHEPGGVVLVAEKGKIIYKKAFGLADVELNVPMREEMVFNIASITKQFTAVAILQLIEQGKVSLQDEITKYLPDYPVNGQKITLENLLT